MPMPMTLDDWLDACADAPEDDLLRGAFADWLDERGDHDRATFLRSCVTLSRLPKDQQDQALVRQADALLERHRRDWLGLLVDMAADWEFPAQRYWRQNRCDEAAWKFPRGLPEDLMLRSLHLGAADIARLASFPHLARLTSLSLGWNGIRDAGAAALAAAPHLARLTHLDLWDNRIGAVGAAALAASPHLARLATLDLSSNRIGARGAEALASSPHLTRLNKLDLWLNRIGAWGRKALRARFGDRVRLD